MTEVYTDNMKRVKVWLAKLLALVVGIPILVLGVILIPLPGPGILLCLLGFFVLSLAFDWPKPYLEKMKQTIIRVFNEGRAKTAPKDTNKKN